MVKRADLEWARDILGPENDFHFERDATSPQHTENRTVATPKHVQQPSIRHRPT
jgi:hypothetical protein